MKWLERTTENRNILVLKLKYRKKQQQHFEFAFPENSVCSLHSFSCELVMIEVERCNF